VRHSVDDHLPQHRGWIGGPILASRPDQVRAGFGVAIDKIQRLLDQADFDRA
jgi:hypothetical protein